MSLAYAEQLEAAAELAEQDSVVAESSVAILRLVGGGALLGATEVPDPASLLDQGLMPVSSKCTSNERLECVEPLNCWKQGCYYDR